MPRPCIVLSARQMEEVETLAALLNQDQIADYFSISRRTFTSILARDEEVAARYKKGKAKAIAHVANGLLQKARTGCTTSSIFYLKTQAGWRETSEIAHTAGSGDEKDALSQLLETIAERPRRIGMPRSDDAGSDMEQLESDASRERLS